MNDLDWQNGASDSEEDHAERCGEFRELKLPPEVMQGIQAAGFERCTDIQALALPQSLRGRDVVAKAQTGTGKTAAFLLTIFTRLLEKRDRPPSRDKGAHPRALVLAPTRELALQIAEDGKRLGKFTPFRIVCLFGGVAYEEQEAALAENPEIIVATPGRLIDYLKQHKISFRAIEIAVVDEADRMFDMGFYPDLRYLMRKLPHYRDRQTMLFSATVSYRVTELSYEHMNGPVEVDVSPKTLTAENVEERLYHVGMDEKLALLLGIIKSENVERAMIFCNTKSGAKWLGFKLQGNQLPAQVLTGDVAQERRLKVVRRFKEGQIRFLIATDVASRGLHVEDISHVFNFDVPEDPENYVHRIGRTARAGRSGVAVTLACERFVTALPEVERYIGHRIPVLAIEDSLLAKDEAGPYHDSRSDAGDGRNPRRRNDGRRGQRRGASSGRPGRRR